MSILFDKNACFPRFASMIRSSMEVQPLFLFFPPFFFVSMLNMVRISQADIFDALPVTKPHFIPEALRKIFAILLCGSNIILIKENKPSPPCMELCQGFLSMLPPSISGHLASLDCSLLPSITNGTCSMQNDFNVTVSKVSINTDCFKAENYPNLGGKMCSGVLTGDFYVQTHIGHSVPILDGVIANGFAGLLPLSSPHFVRPSCRQAIANLFCNRVFPSCQKNTLLETAIGFPVPPLVRLISMPDSLSLFFFFLTRKFIMYFLLAFAKQITTRLLILL